MNKETKNLLFTFLYLLALYLGIKMIPFDRWINNDFISKPISLFLFTLLIFLISYEIKKADLKRVINDSGLPLFTLIPFVLGPLSNFTYCFVFRMDVNTTIDITFIFTILNTIVCVIIEELLFRFISIEFFKKYLKESKYKNILIVLFSSIVFSLMHCINFFGNSPYLVLLQLGYTFVLGIFLSSISMMYENLYLPIIGHFLFNFLNTDLVNVFYQYDMSNIHYIIYSILVGVGLFSYLFAMYFLYKRKNGGVKNA